MTLFDLLFLFVALVAVVMLLASLVLWLRRRRTAARKLLRILAFGLAAYLLIVVAVALSAPQKTLAMGQDRCFDEMCFAPVRFGVFPTVGKGSERLTAKGQFYVVEVRMSNHGRGRAQREAGVSAALIDADHRVYAPSAAAARAYETVHGPSPALTSRLSAGESATSIQVFEVPPTASGLSLHFAHDGPGFFIIGDEESPLHKPTITPLK